MKKYQAVCDRVNEYRYKKGIVRLDTSSGFYKGGKFLYILAFIWLMVFQLMYIAGSALLSSAGQLADNAKELLTSLLIITPLLIIGFVLLCIKKHAVALVFNIVLPLFEMAVFYKNEQVSLSFLEGWLTSKFFWFHFAPSILIIICSLIVCLIGIKTALDFNKDYKKIMESMYIKYNEDHPNSTEEDWQNYLKGGEKADAEA